MSNTTDSKKSAPMESEDAELAKYEPRSKSRQDKKRVPDLSGIGKTRLDYLQRKWATDSMNPKNPLGFSGGGAGRGGDRMTFEQFVPTYSSDFLNN